MGDLKTPIEVTVVPEGMLWQPQDDDNVTGVIDNVANFIYDAFGGYNFIPATNPVTIVPTTGMVVQCGGTGQTLICQGRSLDVCPAHNITIAAAGGSDRLDLIAVKATRTPGSTTITRNVRSDSATPQLVTLTGTLVAGTATVALPTGYTSAPAIIGVTPIGYGIGKVDVASVTTSQVVFQSSDSTDARDLSFQVSGNPTGSTGISTSITQKENQPVWTYVQGSSLSQPATPAGYEAFATVLVPASATSIVSNDITYLPTFPILPALSMNMILNYLTTGELQIGTSGAEKTTAIIVGNNSSGGGSSKYTRLGVSSSATLASILGSLLFIDDLGAGTRLTVDTNGNVGINGVLHSGSSTYGQNASVAGTLGVTGATTLAALAAAASTLLSLGVTNNATIGGTLGITGQTSGTKFLAGEGAPGVGGYCFTEPGNDTGACSLGDGNYYIYCNGAQVLAIDATLLAHFLGAVTIAGTLGVTGNTTVVNLDVDGTLQVDGTATFGAAPTMSGANIANGTIPSAALASIPVGGVVYKNGPHVANTQTQTLTLDAALPPGSWRVVAHANFNMNGAQTVTLTGVDGGTTWETAQSTNDTDQPSNADLWLTGTATGGNQPSITLASSIATPYTGYLGVFDIMCVRTS